MINEIKLLGINIKFSVPQTHFINIGHVDCRLKLSKFLQNRQVYG